VASGIDRRLDKVEANLSPQQVVLLWMNEVHEFGNIVAYLCDLKHAPTEHYPLYRLPEQMKQAVRTAMKGQKPESTAHAERQAVREVVFLYGLVQQCNLRLWSEWRAMCLQLVLVTVTLKGLIQDDAAPLAEYEEAHELAMDAIVAFVQWDQAIKAVAERYFKGATPLFPDQGRLLADSLDAAELVVTLFNDQLKWLAEMVPANMRKAAPPAELIDLVELRRAVSPHALDLARHLVTMARVEAAEYMGENQQALGILRARLWPEQS